jgi:arabinofuranosyltransferase
VSCRSFVDYSTGGLENPLTHLLLAWFAVEILRGPAPSGSLFRLWLSGSLLALNRLDLALLAAPGLAVRSWQAGRRGWRAAAAGAAPLLAWFIFALVYYGTPLPITASAKLFATGVGTGHRYETGIAYFLECLPRDPVTLVGMAGLLGPVLPGARASWPLGLGALAYLGYVLHIGGDYMIGRFLAAPLFVAMVCAARTHVLARPWIAAAVATAVLALGLSGPRPPLASGPDHTSDMTYHDGLSDERGTFYPVTGLISPGRVPVTPRSGATNPFVVLTCVGVAGYVAGRGVHIVDVQLVDPLLARLPSADVSVFRPGHVWRQIPAGYFETLAQGRNRLDHPGLAAYWDKLTLLTRADLWSWRRFRAIAGFLVGEYEPLLASYVREAYYDPEPRRVAYADVQHRSPEGAPWHTTSFVLIYEGGLDVHLPEPMRARAVDVGLHVPGLYTLTFCRGETALGTVTLRTERNHPQGLRHFTVELPEGARDGTDRVHVDMVYPDSDFPALGHLRLLP